MPTLNDRINRHLHRVTPEPDLLGRRLEGVRSLAGALRPHLPDGWSVVRSGSEPRGTVARPLPPQDVVLVAPHQVEADVLADQSQVIIARAAGPTSAATPGWVDLDPPHLPDADRSQPSTPDEAGGPRIRLRWARRTTDDLLNFHDGQRWVTSDPLAHGRWFADAADRSSTLVPAARVMKHWWIRHALPACGILLEVWLVQVDRARESPPSDWLDALRTTVLGLASRVEAGGEVRDPVAPRNALDRLLTADQRDAIGEALDTLVKQLNAVHEATSVGAQDRARRLITEAFPLRGL